MAIETFGSPLNEIVEKQLSNRSINNRKRTPDSFLSQLFNSSWINLISSVNNIDKQADERDKDSKLAERLVLSGGSLRWDGEKLVKREGIDFSPPSQGEYVDTAAYNYNTQTGIRPMPGITGFRVVSKNLFGTLREATVDFNVWSLPELEDIEKLYLRPGYHVIVEWGHTYGLDSEGEPSPFPISTIANYEKFFSEISADTVYKIIEETRGTNSVNYDACLRIVKNFSWSFRQDGGYDCSISIISKGEILEALTVRSGFTPTTEGNQKDAENDFLNSNLLTQFLKVVSSANIPSATQSTAKVLSTNFNI
jgi:hypothetical protein